MRCPGYMTAVILIGFALALPATSISADGGATISGRLYYPDSGMPAAMALAVVPESEAKPLMLDALIPRPGAPSPQGARNGAGLVYPDDGGYYSVKGLGDGDYVVVALIADNSTYADPPPPLAVDVVSETGTSTERGFPIKIIQGRSVDGVDFEFVLPVDKSPGSIRVTFNSFDPQHYHVVPGQLKDVKLDPPVPDAKVSRVDSGTILVENVPPGHYKLVLVTEGTSEMATEVNVLAGQESPVELNLVPPQPGSVSLPTSGSGDEALISRYRGFISVVGGMLLVFGVAFWTFSKTRARS